MDPKADFDKLNNSVKESKIHTAVWTLEAMLRKYPAHSQFLYYQLGALFRSSIGNGPAARDAFLRSLESRKQAHIEQSVADELEVNPLENLTLLSLSFEEYYSFADRLVVVMPGHSVRTDRSDFIEKMERQGYSWAKVMEWRAAQYIGSEKSGPGLYAEAIATYHLMFENRRSLRISDEDYGTLIIGAGTAAADLFAKYGLTMKKRKGAADPSEFHMVVSNIIPYIKDFVTKNPSEEEAVEVLGLLEQVLREGRELTGLPYTGQIVGETRCHNTIALMTKNTCELYQVIADLEEALLVPFPRTPSRVEYDRAVEQEKSKIRQCQDRYGAHKIAFQIDPMKTATTFNCLVGPEKIMPKAWVYYALAMMFMVGHKDNFAAFPLFEKALFVSHDYFAALYGIAACYAKTEDYEKSIFYYQKALELKPDDADTMEELDMAKRSASSR